MRNVLVFALLIGAGFAVAGFFAHGMARLSGIAPAAAGGSRADTRKPVEARKSSEDTALKSAAIESPPRPITAPDPTPIPISDAAPIDNDNALLPSQVIESSPVVSETKAAAAKGLKNATPPMTASVVQSSPQQRLPSTRTTPSTPSKAALVIPPSLSTAQAHEAQCRSLSAYLSELDTIARTRSEPGVQVWIQNQRSTTWERQTELRC